MSFEPSENRVENIIFILIGVLFICSLGLTVFVFLLNKFNRDRRRHDEETRISSSRPNNDTITDTVNNNDIKNTDKYIQLSSPSECSSPNKLHGCRNNNTCTLHFNSNDSPKSNTSKENSDIYIRSITPNEYCLSNSTDTNNLCSSSSNPASPNELTKLLPENDDSRTHYLRTSNDFDIMENNAKSKDSNIIRQTYLSDEKLKSEMLYPFPYLDTNNHTYEIFNSNDTITMNDIDEDEIIYCCQSRMGLLSKTPLETFKNNIKQIISHTLIIDNNNRISSNILSESNLKYAEICHLKISMNTTERIQYQDVLILKLESTIYSPQYEFMTISNCEKIHLFCNHSLRYFKGRIRIINDDFEQKKSLNINKIDHEDRARIHQDKNDLMWRGRSRRNLIKNSE